MSDASLLNYAPIALMFLLAAGFIGVTMVATHWLGPKRKTDVKLESFESGLESKGNARTPFPVRYFLVAILFVLFDVEVIFMYPWAVNFKEFGVTGLLQMLVFISLLLVGFVYIFKKKALEWKD
ncbi:MAG: NADH-quinone oxidoreductase subunit A [Bacteroidota bacterium]|nr:NADH-quinone oxidoreductase subunit A [Bacteroidota bacterium]